MVSCSLLGAEPDDLHTQGNKKSQLQVHVSAGAVQGFRASMEDAHVACALKKHPSVVFCGVFDGHGGRDVGVYARANRICFN